MKTEISGGQVLMVLFALTGAIGANAVLAAAAVEEVPSIALKYDPQSLATDRGARALYQRLVSAAETVCPNLDVGSRLVSIDTQRCRRQAVARAVLQINNPKLVAISSPRVRTG